MYLLIIKFTAVHLEQSSPLPTIAELEQCLSLIWNRSKTPKQFQQPNIGILTTENRKIWAKIRTDLIKGMFNLILVINLGMNFFFSIIDRTNAENIRLIETSLFILCLDDFILPKSCQRTGYRDSIQIAKMDQSYMASMLLHGGGSDVHTANRWWDKFLQIIVSKEGICGVLMEHSASEGITMLNFLEKFLIYYQQQQTTGTTTTMVANSNLLMRKTSAEWKSPSQLPSLLSSSSTTTTTMLKSTSLQWNISIEIEKQIKQAEKRADKAVVDLDLYVLRFNEYGSDFIKQQRISPDAYIQLALQLTYFKLHRCIVSTYESCSLRQFRMGRVDTIRASTVEARDWAQSMCPQQPSSSSSASSSTIDNPTTTAANLLDVEVNK